MRPPASVLIAQVGVRWRLVCLHATVLMQRFIVAGGGVAIVPGFCDLGADAAYILLDALRVTEVPESPSAVGCGLKLSIFGGRVLNDSKSLDDVVDAADRLALAEYRIGDEVDVHGCAGWRVDLTRRGHSPELRSALRATAVARGVAQRFSDQFAGEPINHSEQRAVLHMALRAPIGDRFFCVNGQPVGAEVDEVREALGAFVDAVLRGARRGASGKVFRRVVNIGIGGSDLGPRMVVRALQAQAVQTCEGQPLEVDFVSNVDGQALAGVLSAADPETTLFVIVSKTFTTWETLTNARTARAWLVNALGESAVERHFVAVSTALERVADFGIKPDATFGFWDWVGGRYSLWSAVGLSIALSIGRHAFEALLAGAHQVDHELIEALAQRAATGSEAPFLDCLPVRLALADYADQNLRGARARAVVAYDERLSLWPAYLQQVEMESLGKAVRIDGRQAGEATGAVIFGGVGTDGQHAYFQLLHQGTSIIPVEFIAAARPNDCTNRALSDGVEPVGYGTDSGHSGAWWTDVRRKHHQILLASLLAQADALAVGRSGEQVAADLPQLSPSERAQRVFHGCRPSTVWLTERLTPQSLGAFIAIQEHRIHALGALWGINPFDQWGVELGKVLAQPIYRSLTADFSSEGEAGGLSSATMQTIKWLKNAE